MKKISGKNLCIVFICLFIIIAAGCAGTGAKNEAAKTVERMFKALQAYKIDDALAYVYAHDFDVPQSIEGLNVSPGFLQSEILENLNFSIESTQKKDNHAYEVSVNVSIADMREVLKSWFAFKASLTAENLLTSEEERKTDEKVRETLENKFSDLAVGGKQVSNHIILRVTLHDGAWKVDSISEIAKIITDNIDEGVLRADSIFAR